MQAFCDLFLPVCLVAFAFYTRLKKKACPGHTLVTVPPHAGPSSEDPPARGFVARGVSTEKAKGVGGNRGPGRTSKTIPITGFPHRYVVFLGPTHPGSSTRTAAPHGWTGLHAGLRRREPKDIRCIHEASGRIWIIEARKAVPGRFRGTTARSGRFARRVINCPKDALVPISVYALRWRIALRSSPWHAFR